MEGLGDVIHVIGKSLVVGAWIFDGDDFHFKSFDGDDFT